MSALDKAALRQAVQSLPSAVEALLDENARMLEALKNALHAVDADDFPYTAKQISAAIAQAEGRQA
jgi:hypothetical protein